MILLRYLAFVVGVFFITTTCALPVDAAPTSKNNTQTTQKASSSKVQTKSKGKSGKKATVASNTQKKAQAKKSSSSKSSLKASAKKGKTSAKKKAKTKKIAAKQVDSQQVWLDRAANSDMQTGVASWYGGKAHGGRTASGESYDMHMFTAAHRTLPMGTVVKVIDEASGDSVMVCINDRGPFIRGRVIDLSYAAAEKIGLDGRGVTSVALEVISNAEGNPINENEAFYVGLVGEDTTAKDFIGPFRQFADASVMQEVLRTQHPKAAIVVRPVASR